MELPITERLAFSCSGHSTVHPTIYHVLSTVFVISERNCTWISIGHSYLSVYFPNLFDEFLVNLSKNLYIQTVEAKETNK
jgi:hypothetical protein